MSKISSPYIKDSLTAQQWAHRKQRHEGQVSGSIDSYVERRSHQHKDPVMDFLFEYYSFRPSHLRRWSPGFGILLKEAEGQPWLFEEMSLRDGDAFLDINFFPEERISSLQWILKVLEQSLERDPHFGCFGMHEWAMVYKTDNIRHQYLSLRMNKEELAEFVESRPLVCTHFDAFRFFTKEARPRNKFDLNRHNFADNEQPGCLHTNMDLYKWAFKMYPWISSNTIYAAFQLAVKTRLIDMKASPYDLWERGLEPIKIETKEGRRHYLHEQQAIYEKSQPIRKRLIQQYRGLLEALSVNSRA